MARNVIVSSENGLFEAAIAALSVFAMIYSFQIERRLQVGPQCYSGMLYVPVGWKHFML